jgi:hypothetical protein
MIFTGFCRTTDFEISAAVRYSLSHSYSTEVPDLDRDLGRWLSLCGEDRPMEKLLAPGIGGLGE